MRQMMRMLGVAVLAAGCFSVGGAWGQAAAVPAGGPVRVIAGLQGAEKIRLPIAEDCTGTLVLMNARGQTVRILAQLVPMKAGTYEVAWDGMDLWGNMVPSGTELSLKVITNKGVNAFYEMAVGSSGNPAWLTGRNGEGDAMRQGGNMGDHSGPGTVAAVGNKLFFGSFLVEYGHNLMATTLAGEKMWGTQVEGWAGPGHLTTDGKTLFVVTRGYRNVYGVDPATFKVSKLFDTSPDEVQSVAAWDGKLTLILKNHAANQDPFRRSKFGIDFARSVPAPVGGSAPEFQLSPQAQFSTVFKEGGHFQTGFSPAALSPTQSFAIAAFNEPATVGSVLLEKIDGATSAEVFVLKEGVKLDRAKHVPRQRAADDDLLGDLTTNGDWVKLGETKFERMVEVVTAPQAGMKTDALFIRLNVEGKAGAIRMARIQELRLARVPAEITVVPPGNATAVAAEKRIVKGKGKATGWDFVAASPINDLNPVYVTLDLGKETTFAGLSLQNCVNGSFEVQALEKGVELAGAGDEQWSFVTKVKGKTSRPMAAHASHTNANDVQVDFPEAISTRAVRLKFAMGIEAGRGLAKLSEDPQRVACADVILLGLVDKQPEVPTHLVQVRDTTGKVLSSSEQIKFPVTKIAYDVQGGDGTLWGITDTALVKLTVSGDKVNLVPVAEGLRSPNSIGVGKDVIAVAEVGSHAIQVFDKSGKKLRTLGGMGPYKRGLYDPNVIHKPTNVAVSPDGTIWFAEESYHPKRIAQFSVDGKHLQDMWAPPEYGGGGYLDANLKSFYYRGMEFAIDFEKGTWGMKAFNDRFGSQETPTSDPGSFSYTHAGRPIVHNGRKYAVGEGNFVALLEDNVWKPVAVLGTAHNNRFLVGKDVWRTHWLKQHLKGKGFIWCDHNGDGQYQVAEVELFDLEGKGLLGGAYWGAKMGKDLTFFSSSARLAPSRFTEKGVPIYEAKNIQRYDAGALAPIYNGGFFAGTLAKKGYGGASMVTADGTLALEGQPYRIGPDLQVVGGPLEGKPSEYIPAIQGFIMDNPLGWAGAVETGSPLGELGIMIGDNGHWHIWSFKYNCMVGRIFTGAKGGWSGVPNVRGTDVTDNKQEWECFFGHFMKADNGKYYTVAGKGHHAISRIEGLDDYKVDAISVKVSAEGFAKNTALRPRLIAHAKAIAAAKKAGKEIVVGRLEKRVSDFEFDGELEDWGGVKGMAALDEPDLLAAVESPEKMGVPESMLHVAAASDEKGLLLAYSGVGVIKNTADDPRYIFKSGFCLDFAIRTDPKAKGNNPVAGDKRLLMAPHGGKWIAVLMEYVDPKVPEDKQMAYVSPVQTTRVAHVRVLSDEDVQIKVRSGYLAERKVPAGMTDFTAEVKVSWKALGMTPPGGGAAFRADFGVLSADAGGTAVERRWYWSNPATFAVTDVAVEAAIAPGTFGTLRFEK